MVNILPLSCILIDCPESSKKRLLEMAAKLIGNHHKIETNKILSALLNREKLGSTALGNGIALPHCQSISCENPISVFIRSHAPIDFAASDGKPVDLFFILVTPYGNQEEYLDWLRESVQFLKKSIVQEKLRDAKNAISIYKILQKGFIFLQQEHINYMLN